MKTQQPVAIFTNFMDFNPGYSLACIAVDQAHMLARKGHRVFLFVNEQFNDRYNEDAGIVAIMENYPEKISIEKRTKFMHLKDYQSITEVSLSHKNLAKQSAAEIANFIIDNKISSVYTHDFIFTGWNVPYSLMLKELQRILIELSHPANFFHWIHSVPSGEKDWWFLETYGPNHLLVFPNRTTIMQVVENFRTNPARARIIPHIKDIRTWYDFSPRTMEFLDRYPKTIRKAIIQVYPCSSDRLDAKQLDIVIRLFSEFKKMNNSVCLIAANQWATGRQPMENVAKYVKLAEEKGLVYGDDFIFTSEFISHPDLAEKIYACEKEDDLQSLMIEMKTMGIVPHTWGLQGKTFDDRRDSLYEWIKPYAKGIDRRMLRELQLLGSLFVFPTREESFGLVGPESAYSGCLNVNNRSLIMLSEVMGHMVPAFDFGSHHLNHPPSKEDNYIRAVAIAILQRLNMNESVQTKIFCRQRYNMDYLYEKFYLPLTFIV